jgi:hypothetical protein
MTLLGVTAILESAHIYLKAGYAFGTQALHPKLTSKEVKELIASMTKVMMLAVTQNSYCISRDYWRDKREYERMRSMGSFNQTLPKR